jgi:hypothetical protein
VRTMRTRGFFETLLASWVRVLLLGLVEEPRGGWVGSMGKGLSTVKVCA